MRARGVLEVNKDGELEIRGYQEDTTDQHRREEELGKSETRFRALIESSPDAIAVHQNGRFVYANPRMLRLLGYSDSSDLLGTSFLEVVHPDDVTRVAASIRRLNQVGEEDKAPAEEARFRRRDKSELVAEIVSMKLSFDGKPALFAVVRDVTERRRMQAQLAHSDRLASIGTVAAGVAHEINNPLAYAKASLESLIEDLPTLIAQVERLRSELGASALAGLSAETRALLEPGRYDDILERINDAHDGSKRVQAIVQDLKQFSRSDDAPPTSVDVGKVIERALKMASHEVKYRAGVRCELAKVSPVIANEGRLCQVFLNLLVNAAQAFATDDLVKNQIVVSTKQIDGKVVIEFRDTGPGIPEEHRARLFDPFFTTKAPGKGSGLGLSICRHLVNEISGTIEVQSVVGLGTNVIVTLPAEIAAEVPSNVAPIEGSSDEAVKNKNGGRLLLIDDEPILCRVLKRALSPEHEVLIAGGGNAAISILSHDSNFDVILCDMMMQGISGQDVYEWTGQYCKHLQSRFIFITGGAITERAQTFLKNVPNTVLGKPLDMPLLKEHIQAIVEERNEAADGLDDEKDPESQRRVRGKERRQSERVRAQAISGVLKSSDSPSRDRVSLVDFSEGGLRLRAAVWDQRAREHSIMLLEPEGTGIVEATLRFVRQAEGESACFSILEMDQQSRTIYSNWLAQARSA
jgi:PAS domain S-box-containing protein